MIQNNTALYVQRRLYNCDLKRRVDKKAGESIGGVRATFAGHIGRQSRPKKGFVALLPQQTDRGCKTRPNACYQGCDCPELPLIQEKVWGYNRCCAIKIEM